MVLVIGVNHRSHDLHLYLWIPLGLLPYLMNLLDPQKGQDLSETEFRRSISKLERTGCFASCHSTKVFSISSCSLVLVALLDQENDRNRWCGFLFRFDILAVHWFRRWITWTAKFIKSYSSLKSIWCFLWSNKLYIGSIRLPPICKSRFLRK